MPKAPDAAVLAARDRHAQETAGNAEIAKADGGDQAAIASLRARAAGDPRLAEQLGSLAFQVEAALVTVIAGQNVVVRDAVFDKLAAMRQSLAVEGQSEVERLLVARVVACWLQVQHAELVIAQTKDATLKWQEFYLKRQDSAHRRYLGSLKALAQVRRLQPPIVQLNIGDQQVNVATLLAAAVAAPDRSAPCHGA